MVYEADTLMEIIRAAWGLTDSRVVVEGIAAAAKVPRPIRLFAHEQIGDKIQTKSLEIIKESPLITTDNEEFFTKETDDFLLRLRYKLQGTSKDSWDISESDVEIIETEIERILKLTYNPQNGTNIFFTSAFNWQNKDDINGQKQDPVIIRELRLTITRIFSRSTSAFDSFQRGVIFDLSASSNMDDPPPGDVSYTEVFDVNANEGFREKELQVTDHPDGPGIALFYSGGFAGIITLQSYFKASEVGDTTADLNQIYKRRQNGEKSEIALVRTYTNNASQTITMTSIVRVIDIKLLEPKSDLLQWAILGKIIKPTTMTIA